MLSKEPSQYSVLFSLMTLSSDVCLKLQRNEFFPLLQGWELLGFNKLVHYLTSVTKFFFNFGIKFGDSVHSNKSLMDTNLSSL